MRAGQVGWVVGRNNKQRVLTGRPSRSAVREVPTFGSIRIQKEHRVYASSALFLVATLVGQRPAPPQSVRELAKTATFYYTDPDPAFGPRMLNTLLKRENLDHPFFANNDHILNINAALLGDVAAGRPKIVRAYEAAFIAAPPAGQRLVIQALRNCGDRETFKQIDGWRADRRSADVRA